MITPASLPFIEQSERMQREERHEAGGLELVTVNHADAAAALTRADYGRPVRLVLGLVSTFAATLAILLLTVTLTTAFDSSDPSDTSDVIILAGVGGGTILILAVPAAWLLIALHNSGKRLARSAGYWSGYPYRTGQRQPQRKDWFVVRYVGFSADLFIRLITAALANLIALFAFSVFVRTLSEGDDSGFAAAALPITILYVAVAAGQFGGVQRIQNGMLARDPMSLRLGRKL